MSELELQAKTLVGELKLNEGFKALMAQSCAVAMTKGVIGQAPDDTEIALLACAVLLERLGMMDVVKTIVDLAKCKGIESTEATVKVLQRFMISCDPCREAV